MLQGDVNRSISKLQLYFVHKHTLTWSVVCDLHLLRKRADLVSPLDQLRHCTPPSHGWQGMRGREWGREWEGGRGGGNEGEGRGGRGRERMERKHLNTVQLWWLLLRNCHMTYAIYMISRYHITNTWPLTLLPSDVKRVLVFLHLGRGWGGMWDSNDGRHNVHWHCDAYVAPGAWRGLHTESQALLPQKIFPLKICFLPPQTKKKGNECDAYEHCGRMTS